MLELKTFNIVKLQGVGHPLLHGTWNGGELRGPISIMSPYKWQICNPRLVLRKE